jgi:PPOX class probable FMN-dependent enzyme
MRIDSIAALEALYGTANLASTAKVTDRITPHYRQLIEASPFLVLATAGPEGLDASPRGDAHGLVRIEDDRTLLLPDRRGNNRVDSLRNIVRDPRVGLLFLIPGSGTTLRVNGRAHLSIDPALLASFAVDGAAPRSVIVIGIEEVYFQCARAVIRAGLWDAARHATPGSLPTPGQILATLSDGATGGEAYDREWPARAAKTMW